MNKIKTTFLYLTGLLMALIFKVPGAFAQTQNVPSLDIMVPLYGPPPISDLPWWKQALIALTSPIALVIIALAVIIGIVVLIKRKKKIIKKDNNLL